MFLDPQALGPGKYYIRVYVANSNYYSTNHLYILTISY